MNPVLERIGTFGIVPVVTIDRAEDAAALGRALVDGDLPVAEITFRTAAAEDAIRALHRELPDLLIGAGTILSPEQADRAVAAGASFLVTPGFNPTVVDHCVARDYPIVPGVNSPSQVESGLERGLTVLKFFPAEASGGLPMLKSLGGPYGDVRFIPTGGVDMTNLAAYVAYPKVHAVGGSWMVKADLIRDGRFAEISRLCREAVALMLGFALAHVGVNETSAERANEGAARFEKLFGFAAKEGNSSVFAGKFIELMKRPYLGEKGHIAIGTTDVDRAAAFLSRKGVTLLPDTAKRDEKTGVLKAVYLDLEIGGFAVHLVKR
jgi:2-dehydro-3-deoxyphosphogluconate aldolase/(4S)-4-hydroxy-2-oxoglutarate aldolase